MTTLAFPLPAIYLPSVDDRSQSDSGDYVRGSLKRPTESSAYYQPLSSRELALLQAIHEATVDVAPQAIHEAAVLLDLLPLSLPDPSIVVEADGQIGFDWREADNSLSLNIGKSGVLGYAALFGSETAYGRVQFTHRAIPERVASLLLGLRSERSAA